MELITHFSAAATQQYNVEDNTEPWVQSLHWILMVCLMVCNYKVCVLTTKPLPCKLLAWLKALAYMWYWNDNVLSDILFDTQCCVQMATMDWIKCNKAGKNNDCVWVPCQVPGGLSNWWSPYSFHTESIPAQSDWCAQTLTVHHFNVTFQALTTFHETRLVSILEQIHKVQ